MCIWCSYESLKTFIRSVQWRRCYTNSFDDWSNIFYQINYYNYNSYLILCVFLMLTCKDTCTCFYIEYVQCTWRVIPIQKQTVHVHRPAILTDISIVHRFSSYCATRCFQLAATVHYYCTRGTYLKQETHAHLGYCYFWLTKNHKQNLYFIYLVERKK